LDKQELYSIIQLFLEKRELQNIPLLKEGLLVSRPEGDFIIKVTKQKGENF
jgi:hypothetical protein